MEDTHVYCGFATFLELRVEQRSCPSHRTIEGGGRGNIGDRNELLVLHADVFYIKLHGVYTTPGKWRPKDPSFQQRWFVYFGNLVQFLLPTCKKLAQL